MRSGKIATEEKKYELSISFRSISLAQLRLSNHILFSSEIQLFFRL